MMLRTLKVSIKDEGDLRALELGILKTSGVTWSIWTNHLNSTKR